MPFLRALGLSLLLAPSAAASVMVEMRMLGNCADCGLEAEDFSQTRLMGIDLSHAEVRDVRFTGASMSVAVLNGRR